MLMMLFDLVLVETAGYLVLSVRYVRCDKIISTGYL
jgi:hypothetical protein